MKINQLKAGVILSYISLAAGSVISIIYTPVMLRILGQSEYGLYSLASSVTAYLSLFSLGFSNAYMRFFMRFYVKNDTDGTARLNGMFLIIFSVLGALALISGLILSANAHLLFRRTMDAAETGRVRIIMAVLTVNMALSLPMSVFTSYINALERYVFLKAAGILRSVISPMLTLPVLLAGGGSVGLAAVTASLSVLTDLVYGAYCIKKLGMRFDLSRFDFSLLKELWVFSAFIFINMITDQINWSTDKLVLGMVKGTRATAVYAVASQLNTYYLQFSQAVSSVFIPKVNRIVAETDDNSVLTDLFIRVGRAQLIILGLILSGFIIFGRRFILLWAGEDYGGSYAAALFLLIPVTVPSVQNIGLNIQQAKNKHKFRSVVYFLIAVCNIAVSIPLSVRFGAAGAAAGTAAALVLGNGIAMNIYYHRGIGLDIPLFWRRLSSLLVPACISAVFGVLLSRLVSPSGWAGLITCCALYAAVYCAVMWTLGMNGEEKAVIRKGR